MLNPSGFIRDTARYVFDPPENVPLKVLEWMTQLFWQADPIVGGFTGFYRQGTLILDLRKKAWQYLITWGTFDLGLVIMGWLFILLDLVEDDALHEMACWSKWDGFTRGKRMKKARLCVDLQF